MDEINDLSRLFSVRNGYSTLPDNFYYVGNCIYTGSKGAAQIDEAIRRELEEERGVVLETRRKHITLQLSFNEKEYLTQQTMDKKLVSKIIETVNQINKNSRRSVASYIYAPTFI